jgi:hypothetical protein
MADEQGWFSGKTKISLTLPDKARSEQRLLRFPPPQDNRAFCHQRGAAPQQYHSKGRYHVQKPVTGGKSRSQVADSTF